MTKMIMMGRSKQCSIGGWQAEEYDDHLARGADDDDGDDDDDDDHLARGAA